MKHKGQIVQYTYIWIMQSVKGRHEIVSLSDYRAEKRCQESRREIEGTRRSVSISGFTTTSPFANGVYLLFLHLPLPAQCMKTLPNEATAWCQEGHIQYNVDGEIIHCAELLYKL